MTQPIESQPEPEQIAKATADLVAVLAGSPDLVTRLAVGASLAILGDVYPPYPPPPEAEAPLPATEGIAGALAHLERALQDSTTPSEAIRIGQAARQLRDLEPLP